MLKMKSAFSPVQGLLSYASPREPSPTSPPHIKPTCSSVCILDAKSLMKHCLITPQTYTLVYLSKNTHYFFRYIVNPSLRHYSNKLLLYCGLLMARTGLCCLDIPSL